MKMLFTGNFGKGWAVIENCNGKMAAKYFDMPDGVKSCAGVAKGFVIIYRQSGEKADFLSLQPMHIILSVSVENIACFYTLAQSEEIYHIYIRINRRPLF